MEPAVEPHRSPRDEDHRVGGRRVHQRGEPLIVRGERQPPGKSQLVAGERELRKDEEPGPRFPGDAREAEVLLEVGGDVAPDRDRLRHREALGRAHRGGLGCSSEEVALRPVSIAERRTGSGVGRPNSHARATNAISRRSMETASAQRPRSLPIGQPQEEHARRPNVTPEPHSRHFRFGPRTRDAGRRRRELRSWFACRLGSFRPQCGHREALELTFPPQSLHDFRLIGPVHRISPWVP